MDNLTINQPEATLADKAALDDGTSSDSPSDTSDLSSLTYQAHLSSKLVQAITDLQAGKPAYIFDAEGREEETDIIYWAPKVDAEAVRVLRSQAGGLVFILCPHEAAEAFQLPFLQDIFEELARGQPLFEAIVANDIPYDSRSSFSLWINHRGTFTGITDNDRALTISTFAKLAGQAPELADRSHEAAIEAFGAAFRSPGHVPICVSTERPLTSRYGHTELGVALLKLGGLNPVGAGAEMMGDDGKALDREAAQRIATERGLTFLTGAEIIEAWRARPR